MYPGSSKKKVIPNVLKISLFIAVANVTRVHSCTGKTLDFTSPNSKIAQVTREKLLFVAVPTYY